MLIPASAIFNFVEVLFHTGCKLYVSYVWKIRRDEPVDYHSEFSWKQPLLLAQNIFPVHNSGYNRGVSAGPSDSKLFQGLYQGGFRIPWRRLRKMLLRFEFLQIEWLAFGEVRQTFVGFAFFRLIFCLFVEGQKSRENDHRP